MHTVQTNCEATVKTRERDVLRAFVVCFANLVFKPSAVTFWDTTSPVCEKRTKTSMQAQSALRERDVVVRRRWLRNFERSWPDLTEQPHVSDTRFGWDLRAHDARHQQAPDECAHHSKSKADERECSDCLRWESVSVTEERQVARLHVNVSKARKLTSEEMENCRGLLSQLMN